MTLNEEVSMATKPYIIALEEHYFDPEVKRHITGLDATNVPRIVERLDDLGALRLKEMDEAGIDLQVLSLANPGLQKLDAETAVPLARRANDRLNEAVRAHPDRFAAFAALPTPDPKGGGRRARAYGHPVRVQGRVGERTNQRSLSRRQAVLADL